MSQRYRVLNGLEFTRPNGQKVRLEAGAETDNLPDESIGWLEEQRHIEKIASPSGPARRASSKAVSGPPENKALDEPGDEQDSPGAEPNAGDH